MTASAEDAAITAYLDELEAVRGQQSRRRRALSADAETRVRVHSQGDRVRVGPWDGLTGAVADIGCRSTVCDRCSCLCGRRT